MLSLIRFLKLVSYFSETLLYIYFLFEFIMNFITRPSLEHIAVVQVAATLWNQPDIRALIEEFSNSQLNDNFIKNTVKEKRKEWTEIEERVLEKVPQLIIATSLKEKTLCFIQPLGFQILKWIEYHLECCSLRLGLPNTFCWTIHGIIDKKKTAEVLIKNEAIDTITRYKLACIYCLKDDIPKLWYKLTEGCKKSFYNEENFKDNGQKILLMYWGQYVREKEDSGDSIISSLNFTSFPDPYMFQFAAESGNKVATEYFLQKLIQREELLLETALYIKYEHFKELLYNQKPPKDYYGEVLCFLISQMNDDQLLQIFKECTFAVLKCLLDWPCQNLYVETASRLWNFLPNLKYNRILTEIIFKINQLDCMYCNYQKIFRKLWQQTPHSHKSFFINDNSYFLHTLNKLLQLNDKENVELIFQDATLLERKKFIFSEKGRYIFRSMIRHKEWGLIKFFIPLCISSKAEIVKFKQEFEEYIPRYLQQHRYDVLVYTGDRMEKFFQILDDFICVKDKRKSLDESDNSPAKRPCNIELIE